MLSTMSVQLRVFKQLYIQQRRIKNKNNIFAFLLIQHTNGFLDHYFCIHYIQYLIEL